MNIFNNNKPQGSIFGNTNQPTGGGSIFGGGQQQQGGSIFGGNQPQQQQGSNIFSNQQQQPQGNSIFSNQQNTQQQQQQGNIFGGGNQQNSMFNNQNQQRSNIFGGQQTTQPQQQGNIFGGNQAQQQTGNIFGGNQPQQQGNNIFGGQQQPVQQGTNIFGGQQQQNTGTFGQPQQTNVNQQFSVNMSNMSQTQRIKFRIQEYCRRIDPKNLEHIRIDELNMFKDYRIGDLPEEVKRSILILMNNMKDLRKMIDDIKKENEELDRKASLYCKTVQEKLVKYKQCLIQNIQQSNLLQQVKQQVELIQNQVKNFIIPLYNAHKTGKHHSFDSPDEFSSTIAKKVLQKMIQLNNKVDEIISCQQNDQQDSISEQDASTVLVLEQLLNYYENVSAKVLEFTTKYNAIKRSQIEKHKRSSSYEDVMRRIQDKVDNKMKKDFKCYDLIKEIQDILQKREKRQQEMANTYDKPAEFRGSLSLGSDSRWSRY